MSKPAKYLQAFRKSLMERTSSMKRMAYLESLVFGPVQDLAFRVTAKWQGGAFERTYTYDSVFHYSGTRPPVPKLSACASRRVLMQDIFKERGI